MKFPDDLPHMLEYRLGGVIVGGRMTRIVVLPCLPRRPVRYIGTSGKTDAAHVVPRIPVGCTGWRLVGETGWRRLQDLPEHWLPFLDRKRETELDPRPKYRPPERETLEGHVEEEEQISPPKDYVPPKKEQKDESPRSPSGSTQGNLYQGPPVQD